MSRSAEFRLAEATVSDIPAIVRLFETCLGDEGGVPSAEFWTWKHVSNPFGTSPVLLAWDGERLAGIRAFMKFRFESASRALTGYRAVDTATDPAYRGKGIFKTLTLQLIQHLAASAQNDSAFVFNTPNNQSLPGYLKMGWAEWGRPRVAAWPRSILTNRASLENGFQRLRNFDIQLIQSLSTPQLQIVKDGAYFRWRYFDIPMKGFGLYEFDADSSHYHVFFHHKLRRQFSETRVCDVLKNGIPSYCFSTREWRQIWRRAPGQVVTFAVPPGERRFLSFQAFTPQVTFRRVLPTDNLVPFSDVAFSLGDLELF